MNPARLELILGDTSTSSAAFAPTDITGLSLWLDASDSATLTLDGSNNVSSWADKSGNGRHATQATTTLRPSYTSASQINGINVPKFDGVDDRLISTGYTLAQPTTAFIVFRPTVVNKTNHVIFDGLVSRQLLLLNNSTVLINAGASISAGTVSAGSPSIVCCIFNGAGGVLRVNRVQVGAAVTGSNSLTDLVLGASNGYTYKFEGDIAEFIYYTKVLAADEITSVEYYLKAKWGTP